MSVKYEFDLKSRVWFQTKFHNINFEIAKFSRSDTGFFSRCDTNVLLIYKCAGLKKVAKVVFHFPEI